MGVRRRMREWRLKEGKGGEGGGFGSRKDGWEGEGRGEGIIKE